MLPVDNNTLFNKLKELDFIPLRDLEDALQHSETMKSSFYEVLLEKDLLNDKDLGKLIADILEVPFVNLSQQAIERSVLETLPEIVASKNSMVVYKVDEKGIHLATTDPTNTEPAELLEKKTGEKVLMYFATPRDIEEALNLYKKGLQQKFDELLKVQFAEAEDGSEEENEIPVAKIVDTLISYAQQNKASDVHLEPEEGESTIRFRIDGVLHDYLSMSLALHKQIVTRIKVMAKLRTDEHLSAQDGKMEVALENEDVDIRVSVVPVVEGEKCVLRLLSARSRQFGLQDLGMSSVDLEKMERAYKNPHGMLLSTGPTGSGKTTTIYSVLKKINTRDVNIATIEDPVEYDIEGVGQIQVNPKTNLTFADGLRAILRQDPDIIFVGEIRDEETAGIAVNSAMTGHLVLSTLHTNDAVTTLPRLIDMGIEPFMVASTVRVIIAQRLVRKICESCKASRNLTENELENLLNVEEVTKYFGDNAGEYLYEGKGCEVCKHTGYRGRIGIFEVLEVTPKIQELISSKADSTQLLEAAKKEGMRTMFEDGMEKVKKGLVTLDEIVRVTRGA